MDNFEILERLDSLGYGADASVQCHLDGEFMLLNLPDGEKSFHLNGDRMTPVRGPVAGLYTEISALAALRQPAPPEPRERPQGAAGDGSSGRRKSRIRSFMWG